MGIEEITSYYIQYCPRISSGHLQASSPQIIYTVSRAALGAKIVNYTTDKNSINVCQYRIR